MVDFSDVCMHLFLSHATKIYTPRADDVTWLKASSVALLIRGVLNNGSGQPIQVLANPVEYPVL